MSTMSTPNISLHSVIKPKRTESSSDDVSSCNGTVATMALSVSLNSSFHSSFHSSLSSRSITPRITEITMKRRVRFANDVATIMGECLCIEDMTAEEKWLTWWNAQEYQAIRMAAKFATKHVRKTDQPAIDRIDQGFFNTAQIASTAPDDEFWSLIQNPTDEVTSPFRHWVCRKAPVRGLAKYVSTKQRAERIVIGTRARGAVVDMSNSGDYTMEEIGDAYERLSRHSRLFARCMGHADHVVAVLQYKPKVCNMDIVQKLKAKSSRRGSNSGSRTLRRSSSTTDDTSPIAEVTKNTRSTPKRTSSTMSDSDAPTSSTSSSSEPTRSAPSRSASTSAVIGKLREKLVRTPSRTGLMRVAPTRQESLKNLLN